MAAQMITSQVVEKMAKLASLSFSKEKTKKFAKQLSSVIGYVSKIQSLDTTNVPETSQVTGLENVFREDVVDKKRMLTQEEALSNAKKSHNGYFMVDAIFEE